MLAVVNTQLWWWVARSGGIVAWFLVTLSILWGLTLSTRIVRKRGSSPRLLDLHRYLGVLSIVFTAVHLVGLKMDKFINFKWSELFVPMAAKWKPGPVAWGIVAFYILVAIQLTSWVMKWLPRKFWHAVHLTSFLLFIGGTVHAALAGSDRSNRIMQWAALVATLAVVFLIAFRLLAPRKELSAEDRAQRAAATKDGAATSRAAA